MHSAYRGVFFDKLMVARRMRTLSRTLLLTWSSFTMLKKNAYTIRQSAVCSIGKGFGVSRLLLLFSIRFGCIRASFLQFLDHDGQK